MADVKVNLNEDSYIIHISPNAQDIGRILAEKPLTKTALVVSDENVSSLYSDKLIESLNKQGFTVQLHTIAPGEPSKSMDNAMLLYTKAITSGLDRKAPIIALGGGVVGDLTGFIAATYLRGIPFFQVPTSLLAQIDSSVGGKVAINHSLGKNLIGAFYQPHAVFIQADMLTTLPDRELRSGLAEVIKYGAIIDAAFFAFLENNVQAVIHKDVDALTAIITRSCEIKAKVVEQDEKEESLRMILNFGHTIGHAIEAATGYQQYTHGEAVAIGMLGAAKISCYLKMCSHENVSRLAKLLSSYHLPLSAPECRPDQLITYIARDKKSVGSRVNWILLKNLGETCICNDVPEDIIGRVLAELTSINQ